MIRLSDENENTIMKDKFNKYFDSVQLNPCCSLSMKALSVCLQHFKPLDCLTLRPSSFESERTQYLSTQGHDLERFDYDEEINTIMQNHGSLHSECFS